MSTQWTSQQILALAPDASSAKAGKDLSLPRKWTGLGQSDRALWGECQGSGKEPYRARVDLQGPAFKCSCPSRKFPCKHGLGLFLAHVESPASFSSASPPAWVVEWLAERDERSEAKARRTEHDASKAVDAGAQAERARKRETRVAEGLEELALWLRDLVRQGLAAIPSRPGAFFESMAARLIDAQAPGAARWVRGLRDLCGVPTGRERRLLEQIVRLHLLVEGYRRLDSLAPDTQADLRLTIGWTLASEELLALPGVASAWHVLGRRVENEDRLRILRTWLWSHELGRPALILQFAAGTQPVETSFAPGTVIDSELVYFPGSSPLRALEKSRRSSPRTFTGGAGTLGLTVKDALDRAARAVSRNPWLERQPLGLRSVVPIRQSGAWLLHCEDGVRLPVSARFQKSWELLSLSGGRPLGVFGEWDGHEMLPLSAWNRDGYWDLAPGDAA